MIKDFIEEEFSERAVGSVYSTVMENISEEMRDIIGGILERTLFGRHEHGSNITDILAKFDGSGLVNGVNSSSASFNLFPCDRKGPIRDLFLCICGGKTAFARAMQEIIKYCRLVEKYLPLEKKKSVVLLTDKWQQEQFAKYKNEIKDFCLGENIDFYYFLVTDYGAAKIPYFDMHAVNHFESRYHLFAGEPSDYERALKKIGKYAVYNEGNGEYKIDFEKRNIKCDGQLVCSYIPKHILVDFIFNIEKFDNWSGDSYSADKVADIYLFNTHIFADPEAGIGADLCNIFKRLIDDCLKYNGDSL